jgi:hypothetical protein
MISFPLGSVVDIEGEYRNDLSGNLVDPTTVTLELTDPAGTTTSYTYASAAVTRSSVGKYTKRVAPASTGVWRYRWVSTGANAGADVGNFRIR